jgi:hypothetical protein
MVKSKLPFLQNRLIPFLQDQPLVVRYTLKQDKARSHKAKATTNMWGDKTPQTSSILDSEDRRLTVNKTLHQSTNHS